MIIKWHLHDVMPLHQLSLYPIGTLGGQSRSCGCVCYRYGCSCMMNISGGSRGGSKGSIEPPFWLYGWNRKLIEVSKNQLPGSAGCGNLLTNQNIKNNAYMTLYTYFCWFYLCTVFNCMGSVWCELIRKHSITAVMQCFGIISTKITSKFIKVLSFLNV